MRLRDLLKRRGYRVLIIGDPQRALARFEDAEAPSDCVLFCSMELGAAALDAFNRLGEMERPNTFRPCFSGRKSAGFRPSGQHRPTSRAADDAAQGPSIRAILLKLLSRPQPETPSA